MITNTPSLTSIKSHLAERTITGFAKGQCILHFIIIFIIFVQDSKGSYSSVIGNDCAYTSTKEKEKCKTYNVIRKFDLVLKILHTI